MALALALGLPTWAEQEQEDEQQEQEQEDEQQEQEQEDEQQEQEQEDEQQEEQQDLSYRKTSSKLVLKNIFKNFSRRWPQEKILERSGVVGGT